jgi:NAD(P)-dependent dehydrogenase (short-subunit alcohol dehydrogenase family)
VNAICPGYTETAMMDRAIDTIVRRAGITAEEARAHLARTNPGGRIVTAEEVAQVAVSLCESGETGGEIVLPKL